MANVTGTVACPKCQSKGGDKQGNNRILYDDCGFYCFACGDFKTGTGLKTNTTEEYNTLPMYTTDAILGKRGISAEVIKDYGVSTVQDESGQLFVKFPFHDVNRAETNYQLRAVDTTTGTLLHEIKFSKGKIKLPLFGWKLVTPATKTIVVCEGITDALYFASHYSRIDTVVVGLSSATAAKKAAAHFLAYDKEYKIVLAFDNDLAGNDATDAFVQYFELHDDSKIIYRVNVPAEFNDICEWKPSKEELKEAVESPSPLTLSGLLGADEIAHRVGDYFEALTSSNQVSLSFSPTISNALRFMPGKLIGVIGASGEGKSTFVEHVAMEFLQQKLNVFAVSQEMLAEEFAIKLLRMVRNEPLDNPSFVRKMTLEDRDKVVKQTSTLTRLLNMTDGFGQMSIENIDRHIHKLTSAGRHPDLVIVDHLLAITSDSETGTILEACRDLKALARAHNTCIMILTHTSKPQKGRGIQQPTLNAAYGSSGIPIYCDAALGIASDKESCITMVETVKLERLGGAYANVTFNFKDFCLTEQQPGSKANYQEGEEDYY